MNRDKYIIDDEGLTNVFVSGCRINSEKPTETSGYGVHWDPRNDK